MSMSFEAFEAMIAAIEKQGYDRETAAEYARWIGDTPCLDEEGKVLVINGETGEVLARLDQWEPE
jgi:hypothetical protein